MLYDHLEEFSEEELFEVIRSKGSARPAAVAAPPRAVAAA